MSLVMALKSLVPAKPDNETVMEQYRLTQEARYIEQLYDACARDLCHFMLSQADPQLAQEVCQLAWLRVIERRNSYRNSGSFKGWLFAIARNLLIDELRKQQKWQNSSEEELEVAFQEPASAQLYTSLNEALQALPFQQKEAIVLQQEGFGLQEIAQITNSEPETVKSRLRYGKAKLKAIWRIDHV